ncbi:hypothetical protein DOM22_09070 [Bdellovibrio sp. ZAP7]|uniref:PT domain-containing protein n=1 Tax=Bdellovibrio sp. ZAP7 TaxID=2231053 RepID=UPI0011593862|nr:PT domain-containing protein [Bdellovibrio sp. ZAP7]QDK45292.1 hypothetical protein DOM22_09070 [Bdellovibrio sp. ZAP7]
MSVKNKSGNAILQVLAAIVVMGISFYFLSAYVIAQRKQIVKTKNVVTLKFAVNSAMDYVVFGVRQKYCFDNGTILQNIDACNWKHAGNVERLVMSDEQLQSLREMVAAGANIGPHDADMSKLRLDKIDLMLNFPVSPAHPLFPIVDALKTVVNETNGQVIKVKGIHIVLNRPENSGYLPKAGREVYIMAEASLLDDGNEVIQVGRVPLSVRSQIAIYPREMGSFALVLPKDLHMDQSWNASTTNGDVILHKFNDRASLGTSTGLVFNSPVFVNGNIYLPNDTGDAGTSNYAAVTFADRVYMGNGWILKSDGNPYAPATLGGLPDRYWSDSRVFGGFLNGIENDGSSDAGLEVMSGQVSNLPAGDFDWNRICADYNKKTVDIGTMKVSKIKAKMVDDSTDGSTQKSKYKITLSNYNQYYPQKNPIPAPNVEKWKPGTASVTNINKYGDATTTGAVTSIILAYGIGSDYREVIFDMTKYGTAVLQPQVVNEDRRKNLEAALKEANDTINKSSDKTNALQSDLNKSNTDLAAANTDLAKKKDELNAELAKPVYASPSPSPTVSPSPTASPSASPTVSPSPTASPSVSPTVSPSVTPTASASVTPSPSATTSPSPSPSPTPTPTATVGDPSLYQNPDTIAKLNQEIDALNKKINDLQAHIADLKNVQIPANDKNNSEAKATVSSATAALADYQQMIDNPPKFTIEMDAMKTGSGREYLDRAYLSVNLTNAANLRDTDGNKITVFSVRFKAYDGTYWNSIPVAPDANSPTHLLGYLNYSIDSAGNITRPSGLSATANTSGTEEDESGNSTDIAQACEDFYDNMNSQSFGAANWGTSFAGGTRSSWNFAGVDSSVPKEKGHESEPILEERIFNSDSTEFLVNSIVGNCVIKAGTNFVTGFYTCDNLTIEGGRTKPLTIIGTFIIGKTLKINEQAIRIGIQWSSIYHPQSTRILRSRKILKPMTEPDNVAKCDNLPSPIWHPIPSIQETADRMACNVISLRAKADPFKWTAVDPDCGVDPAKQQTVPTCKRRIIRYFVVEQSREGLGM